MWKYILCSGEHSVPSMVCLPYSLFTTHLGLFTNTWWIALAIKINTTTTSVDTMPQPTALILFLISNIEFWTFLISCMCVSPGPDTVMGAHPSITEMTHITATSIATDIEMHTQPIQAILEITTRRW